jgi:exosortase K
MTNSFHNIRRSIPVLLIAGGLKAYYSYANVNDLGWVLTPTTFLVELVSGETFTFESYAGYMSSDYSFLIAASCSGVNFLITAFVMLSLVELWKEHSNMSLWKLLPVTLGVAYLSTIIANAVRIVVALQLHRMGPQMVWVNPEQLHRFEGIFIYFGFLLFLFIVCEGLHRADTPRSRNRRSILRRSFLPLMIYWLITLGIPILNGAYRQGEGFWEHFLFVLFTPLILVLPLAVLQYLRGEYANRENTIRLS